MLGRHIYYRGHEFLRTRISNYHACTKNGWCGLALYTHRFIVVNRGQIQGSLLRSALEQNKTPRTRQKSTGQTVCI